MNIFDIEKLETAAASLPLRTRDKIRDLTYDSAAAGAAVRAASDISREANAEYADARVLLFQRWTVDETSAPNGEPIFTARDGHRRGFDAERFALEAGRVVEKWQARERRALTRTRAEAAWESHGFLGGITGWLNENRKNWKSAATPEPKLAKGLTHGHAVEEIRERLARIEDQASRTEGAPAPVDDLIARQHAEIDRIAASGAPTVYHDNRDGTPINLTGNGVRANGVGLSESTLIWLFASEIKTRLEAEIRATAPECALSDKERSTTLEQLADDGLALERLEEAHIVAAAEIGHVIHRRRDADPRAILEIS